MYTILLECFLVPWIFVLQFSAALVWSRLLGSTWPHSSQEALGIRLVPIRSSLWRLSKVVFARQMCHWMEWIWTNDCEWTNEPRKHRIPSPSILQLYSINLNNLRFLKYWLNGFTIEGPLFQAQQLQASPQPEVTYYGLAPKFHQISSI